MTYCGYKGYMLQFKYGCYHALKSSGLASRSKNAGAFLKVIIKILISLLYAKIYTNWLKNHTGWDVLR